jgi:type IV pilus assembly protein PilE
MMFHTKSPGRALHLHEVSAFRRVSSRGFTLIELMVTVAIVGILATIAVASYQYEIQKSRRTDARSALMDLAGREEKLFSVTNAYTNDPVALGYGTLTPVGNGYYNVNITFDNSTTPPSYTITATPIGSQASDSTCKNLTVDQSGLQGANPTANAATCWGN